MQKRCERKKVGGFAFLRKQWTTYWLAPAGPLALGF
ncbi:hypothetical protein BH160DRAFT_1826 [Burkholderia sp. H160]|nr:hypothetical protein BH160DRAFT_1826 [Burkholderia sp. H160]